MFTIDVYNSVEFYNILKGTDRFKDLDSLEFSNYMYLLPKGLEFVNVNEITIKILHFQEELDMVESLTADKLCMSETERLRKIERIRGRIKFYKGLIQLIKSQEIPPRCIVTRNIHTKGWIPGDDEYVD